jgi:hypothetical protein
MRRKNARRFDPRYFMEEKTEKPKVLKEMQFGQKEMPADAYAEPVGTPPQRSLERRLQDLEDQIAGTRIPEQRKKLEKERAALKKKLGSGPVAEGHDGPAYASQLNWNKYLNESSYRQHQGGWYGTGNDAPEPQPQKTVDGSAIVNDLRDKIGKDPTWSWMLDPDVFEDLPEAEHYYSSIEKLKEDLNDILSTYSGTTLEDWGL